MESGLLALVTQATLSIIFLIVMSIVTCKVKPVFRVLDDQIDRIKKIDFSERIHKELEKAVSYLMLLLSWAGLFVIWNVEPISNKWFLLGATLIILKTMQSFIPAFLKSISLHMKGVKFDRHTRKLTEKVIAYILDIAAIAFLLWLFNFTEGITALLAGAGFAGIVVGFAAKDVLGNLLSGVIIVLDRPFKIGDAIEVKGIIGNV